MYCTSSAFGCLTSVHVNNSRTAQILQLATLGVGTTCIVDICVMEAQGIWKPPMGSVDALLLKYFSRSNTFNVTAPLKWQVQFTIAEVKERLGTMGYK